MLTHLSVDLKVTSFWERNARRAKVSSQDVASGGVVRSLDNRDIGRVFSQWANMSKHEQETKPHDNFRISQNLPSKKYYENNGTQRVR